MHINEILERHPADQFTVDKVTILTVDREPMLEAELKTDDPDLSIIITQGKQSIKIANRDIPQFVKAIASMCDENYF